MQATNDSFQHERLSTTADADVDSSGQGGQKRKSNAAQQPIGRAWQVHQGEIRTQSLL